MLNKSFWKTFSVLGMEKFFHFLFFHQAYFPTTYHFLLCLIFLLDKIVFSIHIQKPVNFWVQSFHAMVPIGSEIALFAQVMLGNKMHYNFKTFFWKKRPCIPLENGSKLHSSIIYVNLIMAMTELIYLVIKNIASSKMHVVIFSFVDFSWTIDISQYILQLYIVFWETVNGALESNYGSNIFPWNALCVAAFCSCF